MLVVAGMKQVDTWMGISVWRGKDEELAGHRNKSLKDRILRRAVERFKVYRTEADWLAEARKENDRFRVMMTESYLTAWESRSYVKNRLFVQTPKCRQRTEYKSS